MAPRDRQSRLGGDPAPSGTSDPRGPESGDGRLKLEVRPARDEREKQLSLEIYNGVWPWDSVTMDEVRHFERRALDYADFVGWLDGEPAGSLAIALLPSRPSVGYALLTVLPDHRSRGVGTALYDVGCGWLSERGVREAEGPIAEDDDESLAWARRRGFREVERSSRLVLELRDYDPPPVAPPAGIEIVSWAEQPQAARGMYDVACEAFPDIPGGEDEVIEPFDEWLESHMRGSGDLPEATFVALAGEEVVGYAKFSLTAARPRDANHDMTGVKRAWRGRGVAGALKRAQIAWAKDA
ncbi:MAG TPA: GNAT family N-acetyltransferase, partial [Gaiellaceae bacterium]|nr:GNAT family N-acetyltransferase [Gaiellaceae bacterium]